jgi:transcription elongation GreA/GreB family factor
MSTSAHPLTPRQEQSITALLVQGSLQAAAAASGINEKTLRRWLREDAAFQMAYRDARRQVVQQAIVQVQQATGDAVETLRNVMQDPEAPASARVSAARVVLDTAIKAIELEDLEQRIVALETQQGITR